MMKRGRVGIFVLFLAVCSYGQSIPRKIGDVIVYQDPKFYSAFPSIVKKSDGELLLAFRRAPERKAFGEKGTQHTDPNSYLVMVRSRDEGKTWSHEPQLMYAHPFGGSQDPCMVQLRDGTLLCASYGWSLLDREAIARLKKPNSTHGNFVFLGGFLVKSSDGGNNWQGPIIPAAPPFEANLDIFGKQVPAYNRGAMVEGKNGNLYWVVASSRTNASALTGTHLMVSPDKGNTWEYRSVVAEDPKIEFNETSIYETPKNDLVAFIRTQKFDDQTVIARSTDGGKNFSWKKAGFKGHPHHALKLPDGRVLLVYGYRHVPYGIRARVLNAECTDAETAQEIVLRDDGGNGDLGYPWSTLVSDKKVLVVYYFNKGDGNRHIAGTFLDL